MRWILLFLCAACLMSAACAQPSHSPVFVTTQWLANHLQDPDLVVLHVSFNRAEYRVGHVPGARFLWYDWLAISTPDNSTEMPPVAQADTVLEQLGVSNSSRLVLVFTGGNVSTTTRMYLALAYFGLGDRVSVLDGGFDAWKSEKRPVATDSPEYRNQDIELHVRPGEIVDADWVRTHLADPGVVIIDARDKRFYDGNGGGASRTGHIKGAKSIPFSSLADSTNRIKDVKALRHMFEEAGIKSGAKVVSYCHVGQQATVVYAVAKMLGYDAAVYDGSFQDWNTRGDGYPVEKP